jgi:signal transduction histidine kinase
MDARETTIYNTILIAATIIGSILAYLVFSLLWLHRKRMRENHASVRNEVNLLEEERTRMAADLHDEFGPILSAAKFKIASVEMADQSEQKLLNQAGGYLDDIISRMRNFSNELMPASLVRRGAVAAIDEFIIAMSDASELRIDFFHDKLPDLPVGRATHLFRIVQEMVHNAIKHAHARQLTISLSTAGENIRLNGSDNGVGFDKSQLSASRGRGLQNMLRRTDLLGGSMFVETAPNAGTKITVEFPVSDELQ